MQKNSAIVKVPREDVPTFDPPDLIDWLQVAIFCCGIPLPFSAVCCPQLPAVFMILLIKTMAFRFLLLVYCHTDNNILFVIVDYEETLVLAYLD